MSSNGPTFRTRRRRLTELVADGIAIIPTAPLATRNGDVRYPFRANSDFFYLTQFSEPDAVAVLTPGGGECQFLLFCREKDPYRDLWEGEAVGLNGAVHGYGADDAFPIDDIDEILPGLLEHHDKVFYNFGYNLDFDRRMLNWVNEINNKVRDHSRLVDLSQLIHEMRLIKSPEELKVMKRAAEISSTAHRHAMAVCKPGKTEYEIRAEIEYKIKTAGGAELAYPPIVASGPNTCVLHYMKGTAKLADGELLLIDAGAEVDCYAADITRTFPINGAFSSEQRAVYEVVLAAQTRMLEQIAPGNTWQKVEETAKQVLTEGLVDLGLLRRSEAGVFEEREEHHGIHVPPTGHWLGMDVHDVGGYKVDGVSRLLEPGMTMTVEPGIYIPADAKCDTSWHNIGVRIEDSVGVTRDGVEVLSKSVPKTVDDVEALMATG